jgi:beta-glucosidase
MDNNRMVETPYMKKNRYLRCAAMFCATSVGAFLVSRQVTFGAVPMKPLSSFDPQAKALLAQMTLEEKIGQMTEPDQESIT